jgi:hypothetical protein
VTQNEINFANDRFPTTKVLVKWEHANADFNFDLCAWDYAHDFAREHGRSLEWFDIYARNPHMKGNDYAK